MWQLESWPQTNNQRIFNISYMSVPKDNPKTVKEYDKISQYKDMEIESKKKRHLKTTTVPVIVGGLGIIKKRDR